MNRCTAEELHAKHMDEQKRAAVRAAEDAAARARQMVEHLTQSHPAPERVSGESPSPYPQAWNQLGDQREHQPEAQTSDAPILP